MSYGNVVDAFLGMDNQRSFISGFYIIDVDRATVNGQKYPIHHLWYVVPETKINIPLVRAWNMGTKRLVGPVSLMFSEPMWGIEEKYRLEVMECLNTLLYRLRTGFTLGWHEVDNAYYLFGEGNPVVAIEPNHIVNVTHTVKQPLLK